jgi:drug/metabolite transporter (DMT)-like permease
LGLVFMLGTTLAWASLHPVGKLALAEITPNQFAFSRVALALVFLVVVCGVTGRLPRFLALLRRPALAGVVALGLTGFVGSIWLSMTALIYLPAGINSLLANSSPLMIALVSVPILQERLSRRALAGLVLEPVGVALSLTAAALWAAYTAIGRRVLPGQDPLAMGAASCLVGVVPLCLSVLFEGATDRLLGLSPAVAVQLVWCGVVATGLTLTAWVYALKRMPAASVASFQYLIPLFALVIAAILLGEPLTPSVLFGALLVVGGVAAANSRR